jgi:hypothetical protein
MPMDQRYPTRGLPGSVLRSTATFVNHTFNYLYMFYMCVYTIKVTQQFKRLGVHVL